MKRILFIVTMSLLGITTMRGQSLFDERPHMFKGDSIAEVVKPRPWLAAAEAIGVNLAVGGFNRFIMNEPWARINGTTIKNNFKRGFVWDTDKFTTNLFAHPYHGSLYFNAARSNGLNFWQSAPYTVGGSLMWEFMMETEPPSMNDLLATSFGGLILGEITFRMSDLLIDNRLTGGRRVAREILIGAVSPLRAVNRVVSGEAWRKSTGARGQAFQDVPVSFWVMPGVRYLSEKDHMQRDTWSMNLALRLDYGDPFDDDMHRPYEWFSFRAGLDFFSMQPLVTRVNAIGALWGKQLIDKPGMRLMAGVFQHFNYFDSSLDLREIGNAAYRIAEAASVGGGLIYHRKKKRLETLANVHVNGIALGASISDHLELEERDYNLGSGYSVRASAAVVLNDHWCLMAETDNYNIYTWKGYDPSIAWDKVEFSELNTQGEEGRAFLTVFTTKLMYISDSWWRIMLQNRQFSRKTFYCHFDDVETYSQDFMLSLGVHI